MECQGTHFSFLLHAVTKCLSNFINLKHVAFVGERFRFDEVQRRPQEAKNQRNSRKLALDWSATAPIFFFFFFFKPYSTSLKCSLSSYEPKTAPELLNESEEVDMMLADVYSFGTC